MATALDVAQYILERIGPMSAMKLQKLVYYSQAWHIVWEDRTLFDDKIEAWANGPVVTSLFAAHRGQFRVSCIPGSDASSLTEEERESVDVVLEAYGAKSAQWLSDLTHMESPWRDARRGIADGERCDAEITPAALSEYYSSLQPK
jgi:uncharacterized phage-associated protein